VSAFHKYFSVSSFDREWGFFVTSAGHNVIKPGSNYPTGEHPPEYRFAWSEGRILDQFVLLLIGAGRGVLETRGTKRTELASGDIILLPPGMLHRYRPDPATGWEEYWVCFNGLLPAHWLKSGTLKLRVPILGRGMPFTVRDRFADLMAMARQENYSPQLLAALTQTILGEVLSSAGAKGQKDSESERLRRAADIIRKRPEEFDVGVLAQAAGMSTAAFQRRFKVHFGISPAKFAQEERVEHAKRWLTETELPLRTIAERLNFSSEFYLMRAFKRSTGKSPGHWRTSTRKNAY